MFWGFLLFCGALAFIVSLARIGSLGQAVTELRRQLGALEKRTRLLEAEQDRMDRETHWEPAFQRAVPASSAAASSTSTSAAAEVFPQPFVHAGVERSAAPGTPPLESLVTDQAGAQYVPQSVAQSVAQETGSTLPTAPAYAAPQASAPAGRAAAVRPPSASATAPSRSASKPRLADNSLPASLFRIVAQNPLASAGVLLLLVGVGFLFALLAARNIMPPVVRVGLIATGGVLLFGIGLRLEKKNSAVAFNLQGGALAIEFLCGLWAYTGYHLLNASEAFLVLGVISTLAYAWAAFKEGLPFAFIGLLGALATPVLTSTGHGEFSSLVLYCLWITALSIGVAAYLRSVSLTPAALAGITVLLFVALGGNHGDAQFIVAGCSTMALAFSGAGYIWARKESNPSDVLRASVVCLLLFPSLIMAGFIAQTTEVQLADSTLLAGAVGALLLIGAWLEADLWRVWLIMIGSMLAFVAIGMHLHGAGQGLVFAGGALGLFLVANSLNTPIVRVAAFIYWFVSSASAIQGVDHGHTLPLYTAAVVALLAARLEQGSVMSNVYLIAAPLLAGIAVFNGFDGSIPHVLIFTLVWAVVALVVAQVLAWPDLVRSTVWLVPAGLAMMISPEWTGTFALWSLRELVLAAWVLLSVLVVRAASAESPEEGSSPLAWASQLIAVCVSIEIARICGPVGFDHRDSVFAALALVWAVNALQMVRFEPSEQRALVTDGAAAIALLLAMMSMLFTSFSGIDELLLIASFALVVYLHRTDRLSHSWLNGTLLTSVGLLAVAGAILQLVGARDGLDQSVLMLLFNEQMQSTVSILWAAFGLVIVASGSRRAMRDVWIIGAISLAALVVKMFVVDLASLGLPTKVGTFMLVGVLFIALGYFCPLPAGSAREDGAEPLPVEP